MAQIITILIEYIVNSKVDTGLSPNPSLSLLLMLLPDGVFANIEIFFNVYKARINEDDSFAVFGVDRKHYDYCFCFPFPNTFFPRLTVTMVMFESVTRRTLDVLLDSLEKCGQALKDGRYTATITYSRAGFLYAPQVLYRQEKLLEIIKTCNNIFLDPDHVPDISWSKTLAQFKAFATNNNENRTDTVQKLLYNILNLILTELSFDDILSYLYASMS
ncbi:hypothetical protein BDA99DRAFT_544502 [Phascolomyces articulosus]|uniref:Uncharacterized protein n=1 Tax=Phascolomyces articulosus TaxID=60185 RepID=A0AAD5P898_9FUNG|nr:hypothetical protein BDA99DRAFT_544502 [Phascolomyces articulosus]